MSKKDGPRGPVWLLQIGGEIVMMRVAVTYENGNVFQHFGHSEKFKIYMSKMGISSRLTSSTPKVRAMVPWSVSCRPRKSMPSLPVASVAEPSRPWRPLRLTSMAALRAVPMKRQGFAQWYAEIQSRRSLQPSRPAAWPW